MRLHLIVLALLVASPLIWICGFSQEATPFAPSIALERVFGERTFDKPLLLTDAGDESGRLFVIEKEGVVRVFDPQDDQASSKVFLDIQERVSVRGNEEGLLGIAFHPKYKENGYFYIHYSSSVENKTGVLARFQVSGDDPDKADPNSETVLLTQAQPWRNHNGGMVDFGPDGYLYLSFGDGGAANDPHGAGQDLTTWLGAILRIDVDSADEGKPYGIPKDNPFADGIGPDGKEGALPEIYAYGLRNVWRFSFDRETGELWGGDVGQNAWEEVDIIENGGNYGWRAFEGYSKFKKGGPLAHGEHIEPIAVYGRQEGMSITGGYVYRGNAHPELVGSYFYGDFVSKNIWRLQKSESGEWQNTIALKNCGHAIASFAEDAEGELYSIAFSGEIYRIVPLKAEEPAKAE